MTLLLGLTAADKISPESKNSVNISVLNEAIIYKPNGLNAKCSSLTRSASPCLSCLGPRLQSTCQHLGYSQSRSSPLKSFSVKKLTTWLMKVFLLDLLFTILLYLSPLESFHPPMASRTFLPLLFKDVTCL